MIHIRAKWAAWLVGMVFVLALVLFAYIRNMPLS